LVNEPPAQLLEEPGSEQQSGLVTRRSKQLGPDSGFAEQEREAVGEVLRLKRRA
jgi:hypothetical protein